MTEEVPSTKGDAPAKGLLLSWTREHWFAAFAGVVVALAIVLRIAWGWDTSRRLDAALDDVRRRGEPLALADFVREDLPPSENAWAEYAEAARAVATSAALPPSQSNFQYPAYAPRGVRWEALAAESEKVNAPSISAARRARLFNRLQFPQQGPGQTFRREWIDARALANVLGDGAEYAHLRGDDAEAVERLLDGMHLGRLVRQDPSIMSQLVGIGINALTLDEAKQVIPTLNLSGDRTGNPASPAQARLLLAALLDETENRQSFVRCLHFERVIQIDALKRAAGETWAIRPAADATALRWVNDFDVLIRSAGRENGRQARNTLRRIAANRWGIEDSYPVPRLSRDRSTPRYSQWFDEFVGAGPGGPARSLEQFHRESMERRLTAVMLAARLYHHDHGRWPDDATGLVPGYLDAVPADPFREDGGPLGYVVLRATLPDGADRPLVFSDAGDAGGNSAGAIDDEPMYGWQQGWRGEPGLPYRELRQYRDVSFWQPKTRRFDGARRGEAEAGAGVEGGGRSAPEGVDDDPDKPDAPGHDAERGGEADRPAD